MKIEKCEINKIWITFYFRYWGRERRHVYPKVTRKGIKEIKSFVEKLLPVETIEIRTQDGKKYKNAKEARISGILIKLKRDIRISRWEAYEYIYKPIDKVIYKRGAAIYNMWGYPGFWQMDGRHARGNEWNKVSGRDGKELRRKITALKKKYPEISKDIIEILSLRTTPSNR